MLLNLLIFQMMDIPVPIAKKQARTCLIQIEQKNAIKKLWIWSDSEKRNYLFLQKKNTTRVISTQIAEMTGIKLRQLMQNPL